MLQHLRAGRGRCPPWALRGDFIEIYCDAPIEVCESPDIKGMYKKVRAGLIPEFDISSLYQAPKNPELIVNTGGVELKACVQQVIGEMVQRRLIKSSKSEE